MAGFVATLLKSVKAFHLNTSASVTILFAVMSVAIVMAAGVAVDYAVVNRARTAMLAAADAASVGSIAEASPAYNAVATMSSDGPIAVGITDAVNIFNAQLAGKPGFADAQVTATVTKTGGTLTSTVQFTAEVPMSLMSIFGIQSLTAFGSSSASNGLPVFIDFHLLLDNTPSMGIGATTNDINTMVSNTPDKCAFACHDLSAYPNDYYSLAKKLGVQMRIDVLRSATQQLMDTARTTETYSNQFQMAIYTFGSSAASTGLTNISPLTSNLSSAKSAASTIDLMTVPFQNYNSDQDTDYDTVLWAMNDAIKTPGNGTNSSSPKKVLFFVSDGVADEHNSSCSQPLASGGRCQEPINVALCTTMKNRGIMIAVLYTTYQPLPTNAWYNSWIAPFSSSIAANMQACASPGLYFEVSPTQGISDAMNALFQKTVAQARLTN